MLDVDGIVKLRPAVNDIVPPFPLIDPAAPPLADIDDTLPEAPPSVISAVAPVVASEIMPPFPVPVALAVKPNVPPVMFNEEPVRLYFHHYNYHRLLRLRSECRYSRLLLLCPR